MMMARTATPVDRRVMFGPADECLDVRVPDGLGAAERPLGPGGRPQACLSAAFRLFTRDEFDDALKLPTCELLRQRHRRAHSAKSRDL